MGQHVWVPVDPATYRVGSTRHLCTFCGLHRIHHDRSTHLPYHRNSSGSFVEFSMDCDVAQEQVRFYILGRLHGAAAVGTPHRYGNRVISTMVDALVGEERYPTPYVVAAFSLLEEHPGVLLDDLQWELKGGRPKSTDPPLDVDL